MKNLLLIVAGLTLSLGVPAQGKYMTNEGFISFYSHTVIEDITADNNEVASVLDAATGEVAIIVTMTDFQFEKKLMQEHFNENYVESHKYPKAIFRGMIEENDAVDYTRKGKTPVMVSGELTLHGVTQQVRVEGSLEVTDEGLIARTLFKLNPEDYEIKIPRVVRKNIAEEMELTVELDHRPI
jgi:polyisoprenoid-binding protein YceI